MSALMPDPSGLHEPIVLDSQQQAGFINLQCMQQRDSARGHFMHAYYHDAPLHLPYTTIKSPRIDDGHEFKLETACILGVLPFGSRSRAQIAYLIAGTSPHAGSLIFWTILHIVTRSNATKMVADAINGEYNVDFVGRLGVNVAFPQNCTTPEEIRFARYLHESRSLRFKWPFLPSEIGQSSLVGRPEDAILKIEFAVIDLLDHIESTSPVVFDRQVLMVGMARFLALLKAFLLYAGSHHKKGGFQWVPGFDPLAERGLADALKFAPAQHNAPAVAARCFFALYKMEQVGIEASKDYSRHVWIDLAKLPCQMPVDSQILEIAIWAQRQLSTAHRGEDHCLWSASPLGVIS